jgi:hypothetical protein
MDNMDGILRTLVWRLRDELSLEYFSLGRSDGGWFLAGTVVGAADDKPMLARYRIACNATWETRSVDIALTLAGAEHSLHLAVDVERRWFADGQELEALRGCIDVDLGVSPATNTLPIRRLGLQIGESTTIEAAWVLFPSLEIVRATQRYTRTADLHYVYGGSQRSYELDVDDLGLVRNYDQFWVAEAVS